MEYQRKPVKGYEENYEVDTEGNVFSLKTGKKLSPLGKRIHPYLHLQLCKNGEIKNILIHRIVAEAFIPNPNPEELTMVNHKDGNKNNNNVDNLEWVTPSENNLHYINSLKVDNRLPKELFGYNKNSGVLKEYFEDYRAINTSPKFSKMASRIFEIANETWYGNGNGIKVRRKTCMGLVWSWKRLSKEEVKKACEKESPIKASPKEWKTIYAYDTTTGEIVGRFHYQKEVVLAFNPNPPMYKNKKIITSRVGSVLRQEYDAKTYFGYFLSYEKLIPEQVKKKFETRWKKVFSYDPKSGELIEEFNSEKEVRQKISHGKSSTELYRILRNQNRRATLKGRYWSYEKLSPNQVKEALLKKKQRTKNIICKETGKIYPGVSIAMRESGAKCSYSTFCYWIRDRKEINGLHFEYYEPEEEVQE